MAWKGHIYLKKFSHAREMLFQDLTSVNLKAKEFQAEPKDYLSERGVLRLCFLQYLFIYLFSQSWHANEIHLDT